MKHTKRETRAALALFNPPSEAEKSAALFRDNSFTELPAQHLDEHSRWLKHTPYLLVAVLDSGIILMSTDTGVEPWLAIRRGVQI